MGTLVFGYRKLIAWQQADELAHYVYNLTLKFPKDELFGMTSQLRRAVLSVPLNIVEGHARNNKKEFHRFLAIALGSLVETEYLLEFAFKRGYINEVDYKAVNLIREKTGNLLWKLFVSQK